jgi:hypothetical protein
LGRKLLKNAFAKGYDSISRVISVECAFDIKITENVSIKGFIDKVTEIDENTIELTDYKSGAPFSIEACQSEYQPYFYKIAAKTLFPQYKNHIFSFHFLKNKKTITVDITNKDLKKFRKYIIEKGMEMLKLTEETATHNRSWKCERFCKAKDPNFELGYMGCPAFYSKSGEYLYRK